MDGGGHLARSIFNIFPYISIFALKLLFSFEFCNHKPHNVKTSVDHHLYASMHKATGKHYYISFPFKTYFRTESTKEDKVTKQITTNNRMHLILFANLETKHKPRALLPAIIYSSVHVPDKIYL